MSDDLFPDLPPVLSPRLQWMKDKDAKTVQLLTDGQECELTGREGPLWACWHGKFPEGVNEATRAKMTARMVLATTEDDAIERLAQRNGWQLWH